VVGRDNTGLARVTDLRCWPAPTPCFCGGRFCGPVHVQGHSPRLWTDGYQHCFCFVLFTCVGMRFIVQRFVAGRDVTWRLLGVFVLPRAGGPASLVSELHAADGFDLHFSSGPLSVCFFTCPGHACVRCPWMHVGLGQVGSGLVQRKS
jgi:hypothetical protein